VIVTVADDALASIHELAAELAAKGMKVERVLPVTGVISGSYAADLAGLGRVKGVESVEEELRAHLPPAGDKLQ
jgi:hypothetical protein